MSELAVQRGAADAQRLRGLRHVATGLLHGLADHRGLHLPDRHTRVVRRAWFTGAAVLGGTRGQRTQAQAIAQRDIERRVAAPCGVKERLVGQSEQRVGVHVRAQARHDLPCHAVGAADVAVGVQAEQRVCGAAQTVAGPVQAQQQLVPGGQHRRVFDLRGRLHHQVLELGALGHVHAGQVQHAHAAPLRVKQRCAGAGVVTVVEQKMLATVQPHRLQFGQRGADGGGADGALRQVGADARDQAGAQIAGVDRAAGVQHDTVGIGQDGKVAGVGDRFAQTLHDALGRLQKALIGILRLRPPRRTDDVKLHALVRPQAE